MHKFAFLIFAALLIVLPAHVFGEDDPDPNSPSPLLFGWETVGQQTKGTREPVVDPSRPYARLRLADLGAADGADPKAFGVFLYQRSGRTFQLPIEKFDHNEKTGIAITVRIADSTGYFGEPRFDGESLIYVTWRGSMSNVMKIRLGKSGGSIEIPAGLRPVSANPAPEVVGYRWSGDRIRFLEQAAFGPTAQLDNRLRRIGIRTWLAEQFEAPYPTIPYPDIPMMPTTPPSTCSQTTAPACYRERYSMQPLQQWFFKEAYYGDAQLRHRVAWALSQILVTSGLSIRQSSHMIAYHKLLASHAFGNYRDLLYDVTLNPAMGDYLDMVRSTKNNPNENYGREILQLFSIGLFKLNQDGTIQRDASNDPIPTYDQNTVNNFAKIFTGWTFCNAASCPNATPGIQNFKDPMLLVPDNHDLGTKTLLDYPGAAEQIPACADCATPEATSNYAYASLNAAIDNIFNHPNVGPYVGRILIQHLVTSDPSPAYVERVANVFNNNGQNVRGDLRAVIKAILLDPEARGDVKTAPRYGKLREPVQLMTNLGRNFPARSWDGESLTDGGLSEPLKKLGQNPFNSPTVFNYYPPDFIVPGTSLNAPEFALLNTSLATNRTNFLYVLIFDGYTPNATDSLRGTSLDLTDATEAAIADPTGNRLVDLLNFRLLHGTMSAEHRSSLLTAILAVPESSPTLRAKQAVYLVAASSQFQIQR